MTKKKMKMICVAKVEKLVQKVQRSSPLNLM